MSSSNMKVLVVGGAGYIGGSVTDLLLEKKIPFTVYDSLVYEDRYSKACDFIFGDVRDTEKLCKLLPHYTHLVWLAAIVGDGACALNPEATVEINELAPKWVSQNYDGRIIFISTCSVYGHNENLVTEEDEPSPLSLYANTKVSAERYFLEKNSLVLRLGTAFGISDQFSRPRLDLLVNTLASNAALKGKIMVFGGSQWRPNIHVRDIAAMVVEGLTSTHQGIYNAATQNYTVDQIAHMVEKITGCELRYADQLREDRRNYHVSFEKATKAGLLTLPTKYDIPSSIKEFYNLVKSGRVKDAESSRYSNVRHLSNSGSR